MFKFLILCVQTLVSQVEIGKKSEAEKREERRRRKEEIAEKRRVDKEALPLLF